MTVSLNGTSGITFPDASVQNTAATGFGFKNRLINGNMVIDQRNAGAAISTPNGYTVDRFRVNQTTTGKLSAQQNAGSVTPPTGFSNYLGTTSLSAYTVAAGDAYWIDQAIEGFNFSDMAFGTANAKTITLSFWVYSSLTGTFGGALRNSATTRSYPFTYTISSANTWTQIAVTIAGDTTGTWIGGTNGVGVYVSWGLGVGSTYSGTAGAWAGANYISATGAQSIVGTSGATFYITGVQLEKGSTATAFDYRPYGTELALCQRYYFKTYNQGVAPGTASQLYTGEYQGICYTSSDTYSFGYGLNFPVTMRTAPTIAGYNPSSGTLATFWDFVSAAQNGSIGVSGTGTNGISRIYNVSSSWVNGHNVAIHVTASAEL